MELTPVWVGRLLACLTPGAATVRAAMVLPVAAPFLFATRNEQVYVDVASVEILKLGAPAISFSLSSGLLAI